MKLPAWLLPRPTTNDKAQGGKQKYVLVPPVFNRDVGFHQLAFVRLTSIADANPAYSRLFADYMTPAPRAVVLLSPPADERLTIHANVTPQDPYMSLRFQPLGLTQPHTFVEATVAPQSSDKASVRASLFDVRSGLGVTLAAPLAKRLSGTFAQVGLRYAHPDGLCSAGVLAEPANRQLTSAWMMARYAGIVAGLQLRTSSLPAGDLKVLRDLQAWRAASTLLLMYEPPVTAEQAQRLGRFSAALELQEDRLLKLSFFQHMAQVRPVVNPIEDRNVVGITNYMDIGLQICIPTNGEEATSSGPSRRGDAAAPEAINVAGAWQVNKNWLLKLRLSDQSASACVALKTWNKLGVVGAANVTYRYGETLTGGSLRYGLHLQLENFGEKRYERGASDLTGRAVMQRHVADEVEVANAEGRTQLVLVE